MNELRCSHTMHGTVEGDILEVKCNTKMCGARRGVVVLHRFNIRTGHLIDTNVYRDPIYGEVKSSAATRQRTAVRSS